MKDHVSTNLSLPPIGRAALQVLSELDADSATGTVLRLLREELQRVAPGVWQQLALEQVPQLDSPEARSEAYADRMREALRTSGVADLAKVKELVRPGCPLHAVCVCPR